MKITHIIKNAKSEHDKDAATRTVFNDSRNPSENWIDDNGRTHRLDGPAVTFGNSGEQQWWCHGKVHRVDGPAIIRPCHDGSGNVIYMWYNDNQLHRDDGPAIVSPTTNGVYYYRGNIMGAEAYWNRGREEIAAKIQPMSATDFIRWCSNIYNDVSPCDIDFLNRNMMEIFVRKINSLNFNNDEYTMLKMLPDCILRDTRLDVDGLVEKIFGALPQDKAIDAVNSLPPVLIGRIKLPPAVIAAMHGNKSPSIKTRKFFANKKTVKVSQNNGYASDDKVEDPGTPDQSSYVGDDKEVQKWVDIQGRLHRIHGPAQIFLRSMEKQWYYHGRLDNDNGPAVTRPSGTMFWYCGGELHREDGPAYILVTPEQRVVKYYIYGSEFIAEDYWRNVSDDIGEKLQKVQTLSEFVARCRSYYIDLPDADAECASRALLPFMAEKLNKLCTQYVRPQEYALLSDLPLSLLRSSQVDVQGIVDRLIHNIRNDKVLEMIRNLPQDWLLQVRLPPDVIEMFNQAPKNKPPSTRKFFSTQNEIKTAQSILSGDAPTRHEKTDGSIVWLDANRKLHREDGPAVEKPNGDKEWWLHGNRHRMDGPAIENNDGYRAWYQMGKMHRIDGPAEEFPNGCKNWYQYGLRSRVDGPAVDSPIGQTWYLDGKVHRDNGPAIEHIDGLKEWYNMGNRHRMDGPAVINANGTTEWWVWNKRVDTDNRTDLARLFNEATKGTPQERLNAFVKQGQAITDDTGDGNARYLATIIVGLLQKVVDSIPEDDYAQCGVSMRQLPHHIVARLKLPIGLIGAMNDAMHAPAQPARGIRKFLGVDSIIKLAQHRSVGDGEERWTDDNGQLHREDGPAYIRDDGTQEWWWHGQLHRDGGPAIIYADGSQQWYYMGKRHRKDGPAIENASGTKEWWLNGEHLSAKAYAKKIMASCRLPSNSFWIPARENH